MLQIPRKISHDVLEIPEILGNSLHVWARAHRPPSVAANSVPKRRKDTEVTELKLE